MIVGPILTQVLFAVGVGLSILLLKDLLHVIRDRFLSARFDAPSEPRGPAESMSGARQMVFLLLGGICFPAAFIGLWLWGIPAICKALNPAYTKPQSGGLTMVWLAFAGIGVYWFLLRTIKKASADRR